MSIGSLSTLWQQQQAASASNASASTASPDADADWLQNMMSALASQSGSNDPTATTATLSDQMQALLVQLQGGNTIAPTGAEGAPGSTTAAGPTQAASGHHHHHHHGGGTEADSVEDTSTDLATNAASTLTGADADPLDSTASTGFAESLKQIMQSYGSAAIQGAATGATIAAI